MALKQLRVAPMITRRNESQSVQIYLNEVSKIPMLTVDEEVEAGLRVLNGDKSASDLLVRSNLRFVISVAKQYQNQGLGLMDLINEGNLGLIIASEKFDVTKGFKFITYAVNWIRQTIIQAISDNVRVVRLPMNQVQKINKVRRLLNEAEQKIYSDPNPEDIECEELAIDDIYEAISLNRKPLMLDSYHSGDEEVRIGSLLVDENSPNPEEKLLGESFSHEIRNALSVLTERELDIISKSFGLNNKPALHNEDIAKLYNMTPENVRQIIKRGLKKMKKECKASLIEYL